MAVRPSALLRKLSRMLAVLNQFQKEFARLVIRFSWIPHIAHLLNAGTTDEDAPSQLLTFLHGLRHSCPHEDLLNVVAYLEKITAAFTPSLFEHVKQPLLPRTTNALELFIGRIKKSRRHITGRKNTQAFMLRAGSFVAMLFGLPQTNNWVEAFSRVTPAEVHHSLILLRQTDKRSKCWHVRRDFIVYLTALEQHWVPHE
jgi:hypothetical protein